MADVKTIFGVSNVKTEGQLFFRPERQSIEQTEDYATKKVVQTQEIVVNKLFLDKDSDTYFQYNSSAGKLELYVNGSIVMDW